ncbi:GNAT family N-acetyltransferase [Ensifer sp. HO-A22]|uniref:GNAT family N-acetyltransferase n=1 Tax=Ensifer oleiphilus TaxID=2742698 RepID=A0A7Y6UMB0_9HYPH|nr:GNAT family N-acetyltransferase [Ensifer oleiphilus]NVD38789.1 GNAT family N-acetyltransferase [Ensifer oleiphilus]
MSGIFRLPLALRQPSCRDEDDRGYRSVCFANRRNHRRPGSLPDAWLEGKILIIDRCLPTSSLPQDFDDLRNDASSEGCRSIERLHEDWCAGNMRFDGRGETLLIATIAGTCAGIAGLTVDPSIADALQLHRFYVRPPLRGAGLGRQLATKLLDHALKHVPEVTVNVGTAEAGLFWENMGLTPSGQLGITHRLRF